MAVDNGKVVGFAIGRVMAHPYRLEDTGFLSLIGVRPEYQRKGIATKLVKSFLAACQKRNIRNISTLINLHDRSMISFFKSIGFQQNEVAEFTVNTQEIS